MSCRWVCRWRRRHVLRGFALWFTIVGMATSELDQIPLSQGPQPISGPARFPGQTRLAPVRLGQLRAVAALQRRAFKPRLAYSFPTLLFLRFYPRSSFLVATDENQVVGCAIGDWDGRQSRVVNICVDPESRRRGIATRLLRQLEQELPEGDIVLMAEIENQAARSLYIKEGYSELGIIRNYYGRGKDGVWMQKNRGADSFPPVHEGENG